jgi:hypothetical protein
MNGINRKLHELESKVVNDDITDKDCFLDMTSLPATEAQLHRIAQDIARKGVDIAPEEREIVLHSSQLITERIFLLFRKMIKTLNFIDGSDLEEYFDIRLMWFLRETRKLGDQILQYKQVAKDNPDLNEDELEAKYQELETTFEDLWTEKSFDTYERDVQLELFKKLKERELEEQKENGE